jgi:predicted transcriptional regulator
MAEKSAAREVHRELVAQIVRSYVEHHSLGLGELSDLISTVHRSLSRLGESQPAPEKVLVPVVPIKRSVQRDYVVCLDCGFRGKMLRRHISNVHGLETADYRARWKLSADHPLTAPSYSERRSAMAKQLGLGRRPAAVVTASALLLPGMLDLDRDEEPGEAGDVDVVVTRIRMHEGDPSALPRPRA